MDDLRDRLANRVQLTTDGHKAYLQAVEGAFGSDVDYAQLVKLYGEAPEAEKRYSPAVCIGARKTRIEGDPDPNHVSTSYAERSNLTMRMHNRRFTWENAFSKKFENHVSKCSHRTLTLRGEDNGESKVVEQAHSVRSHALAPHSKVDALLAGATHLEEPSRSEIEALFREQA
jgi:hypothetical protein